MQQWKWNKWDIDEKSLLLPDQDKGDKSMPVARFSGIISLLILGDFSVDEPGNGSFDTPTPPSTSFCIIVLNLWLTQCSFWTVKLFAFFVEILIV